METQKQPASEYQAGREDGAREAREDRWTREMFDAYVRACGAPSSAYDLGFRAGAESAL
jgi:hypothetical protein